jgi:hypothetical protein
VNTDWNTVNSYSQTWNGSAWSPAATSTTYNTTASTTECRYKCSSNFYWNGSACVQCTENAHCNVGAGEICSNNQCVLPCSSTTSTFDGTWTDSKGNNWTTNCTGTGCVNWVNNHGTYIDRAVHLPSSNAETSTANLVSPQYTRKSGCSLTLTYDVRFRENSTTSDWLKLEVCTGTCSSWTTLKTWTEYMVSWSTGEVIDISTNVPAGTSFRVRWSHYSPKVTTHYQAEVDNFIISGI